jgi:hypothetical protein
MEAVSARLRVQLVIMTGLPGGDVVINEVLAVSFVHHRWEARGLGWLGQAQTREGAVLDWLAHRLGVRH